MSRESVLVQRNFMAESEGTVANARLGWPNGRPVVSLKATDCCYPMTAHNALRLGPGLKGRVGAALRASVRRIASIFKIAYDKRHKRETFKCDSPPR